MFCIVAKVFGNIKSWFSGNNWLIFGWFVLYLAGLWVVWLVFGWFLSGLTGLWVFRVLQLTLQINTSSQKYQEIIIFIRNLPNFIKLSVEIDREDWHIVLTSTASGQTSTSSGWRNEYYLDYWPHYFSFTMC